MSARPTDRQDWRLAATVAPLAIHAAGEPIRKITVSQRSEGRTRKLTADLVRLIRQKASAGRTRGQLATEYGISVDAVWRLVRGLTWRNVA